MLFGMNLSIPLAERKKERIFFNPQNPHKFNSAIYPDWRT